MVYATGESTYGYNHLQSPIVRIHWGGFVGDTLSMQRAGWRFEKYRAERTFNDIVAFHHPIFKTYGKFMIDDVWNQLNGRRYDHPVDVSVEANLAGDMVIRLHEERHILSFKESFEPLDMEPRWVDHYVSKMNLFASASPKEQRIILPKDPTVDELLQQIIAKQQPGQVEYFNNKVKNREVPEATMMGQIIQLRA